MSEMSKDKLFALLSEILSRRDKGVTITVTGGRFNGKTAFVSNLAAQEKPSA